MKKLDCNFCDNKDIAQNDIIKIDGNIYCSSCFETHFPDKNSLKDKVIDKEFDPTICSSCNKDFGDVELQKISTYPICTDCEIKIKNQTFPTWVKAFFIGILIIVTISFIWNWNYYSAYNDIKKSNEYCNKKDYKNATLLMESASKKVPELDDLKTLASFYKGIEFLMKDKSAEALIELEKCRNKLPDSYDLDKLIIKARIGASFDNKDYKSLLVASKEYMEIDTSSAWSLSSVASAYACLFAINGDEADKTNAIQYLNKAKLKDSISKDIKEYYNRLEYRIDSRNIIREEEFYKKFPNGWSKN